MQVPVEQVFAFHEREDTLPRLSPPFPPMRVVSRTGGIRTGARVELRIGPVRWLALHTDYRVNALFGQLVAGNGPAGGRSPTASCRCAAPTWPSGAK